MLSEVRPTNNNTLAIALCIRYASQRTQPQPQPIAIVASILRCVTLYSDTPTLSRLETITIFHIEQIVLVQSHHGSHFSAYCLPYQFHHLTLLHIAPTVLLTCLFVFFPDFVYLASFLLHVRPRSSGEAPGLMQQIYLCMCVYSVIITLTIIIIIIIHCQINSKQICYLVSM